MGVSRAAVLQLIDAAAEVTVALPQQEPRLLDSKDAGSCSIDISIVLETEIYCGIKKKAGDKRKERKRRQRKKENIKSYHGI